MIFIEWPWMNETFNRKARKVKSWMSEKRTHRNSALPMLNKMLFLKTVQNLYQSLFLLKLHVPSLELY